MLKYKINIRDLSLNINNLKYNGISHDNESIIIEYKSKNILTNDVIVLLRNKNGEIYFNIEQDFTIIDNSHISIPILNDYVVSPTFFEEVSDFSDPNNIVQKNALCFTFENVMHDFFDESKYGEITISENINNNSKYWLYEKRRCAGDWVLFNNIFLLKSKNVESDGRYVFEKQLYNTRHDIYFYDKNGNKIILKDCIVPVLYNGRDNRRKLYWPYDENDEKSVEIRDYIINNFDEIIFKTVDDRFYFLKENNIVSFRESTFTPGLYFSNIGIEEGHTNINIPFSESIENNMLKTENIGHIVEDIIEENVNDIVDMEKQMFYPSIINNKDNSVICDNVSSINFNLKFRKRYNSGTTEDNRDEMESIIYAWENDDIDNEWYDINVKNGDLIGYAGYTNNDIYYRKKNVKKSFMRLSFYDTKSRATQSLLFYSTIFLNAGELYGKYIKNISYGVNDSENNITLLDEKNLIETIRTNFSIKNSFDKTNSSEGYYLYLFPNLCKGTLPTEIYMKVEFNHAKFGKIIPFILPKTNNGLPKPYYITEDNGTNGIKELFDDLYIKIQIKYDKESNKYLWYIDNEIVNDITNNTINLTLYEPVVNKY